MSTSTENLQRPAIKVFRRHDGDADIHLLLASLSHHLGRSRFLGILRRRRCGKSHRQERSLVRAGGHAVQLCGPCASTSSPARCLCAAAFIAWSRRLWAVSWPSSRSPRCCSITCSPGRSALCPPGSISPDFLLTLSITSVTTLPFPTTLLPPASRLSSPSISGGRTSREFMSRASGLCRS